jgi:hypothetical protein
MAYLPILHAADSREVFTFKIWEQPVRTNGIWFEILHVDIATCEAVRTSIMGQDDGETKYDLTAKHRK